MDTVQISVGYPGASPEEVENGIILAIEEAIEGLEGIDEISSTASEGAASISVEAMEGDGCHPSVAGDQKRGGPHRHLPR